MKATIENGEIVVRLPISPRPSRSGKSITIASSDGNKTTDAEYDGKLVTIGFNAYVKK